MPLLSRQWRPALILQSMFHLTLPCLVVACSRDRARKTAGFRPAPWKKSAGSCPASTTPYHRLGGLNPGNAFSHHFAGYKPKIKVSAGLFFLRLLS